MSNNHEISKNILKALKDFGEKYPDYPAFTPEDIAKAVGISREETMGKLAVLYSIGFVEGLHYRSDAKDTPHLWKISNEGLGYIEASAEPKDESDDLSFQAHGDAISHGCKMCGNEWKSLNQQGYCSSCWTVWNS
jgi:hypothetical protein